MLAVLRVLSAAKRPLSIRGLGIHAGVSAAGTHGIVRKLAAAGFVKTTKTKRDVLVQAAGRLPKWIGLGELEPPKSFVAKVPGFGQLTVFRRGARGKAAGVVVEMRVLPRYPTDEDEWLALYVHDTATGLGVLKPEGLNLARLRRRLHQEGLYRHAVRSGLAARVRLKRLRGPQTPRRDARRRAEFADD